MFHGQHFTARIIATAIAADDNVVVVLVLRRQHFNDEHRRNINGVYDEPFTVAWKGLFFFDVDLELHLSTFMGSQLPHIQSLNSKLFGVVVAGNPFLIPALLMEHKTV